MLARSVRVGGDGGRESAGVGGESRGVREGAA